jgi:hypothetical protein
MFTIAGKYYLPKPYLSYSAINDFYYNRDRFRAKYYEGRDWPVTPELIFGKSIGERLEAVINERKEPITAIIYSTLDDVTIPHGDVAEKKLEFEVDGIPVLGFIDSFLESEKFIVEMKTGKTPWTQGRVDKHFQLDVYSLGVEILEGKVNDECMLVWLETEKVEKPREGRCAHATAYDIQFTGKVREFRRTITNEDRASAYDRIITTAQDISEDYTDWLSSQEKKTQSRFVVREGRGV